MSAPTTAEVRKMVASAAADAEGLVGQRWDGGCSLARAAALRTVALPLAEHRDALAAEVARLKALIECGASPYGVHRCCHCDSEVT